MVGISILVGTLILWGVTALVVTPLAQFLASRGRVAAMSALDHCDGEGETTEAETSMPTHCFIAADVLVLSAVGLLVGLISGYFLVGFAWSWVRWPGILCLIIFSVLGASLHY
jgi:hypothetical protein